MKKLLRELNSFVKGFILFLRPGVYLGFLAKPFLFSSNLLQLTRWISKNNSKKILNDFYRPVRNYSDREKLYVSVLQNEKLSDAEINYLEFGVFQGAAFKWWLNANKNPSSKFFGFDTFEGLPESWGTYGQGDMSSGLPQINDTRHEFVKGLFQETLFNFLSTHDISNKRRVIHMDADLFSSTLFVLTTLAPHLRKEDIIFFDEFNVPNHEFFAFKIFCESFYIKFELLGAVNNFYQVAFKVV
ncbi:MAG: class I SAM-dependent methyltransferase [Chitinophagales bacterium]